MILISMSLFLAALQTSVYALRSVAVASPRISTKLVLLLHTSPSPSSHGSSSNSEIQQASTSSLETNDINITPSTMPPRSKNNKHKIRTRKRKQQSESSFQKLLLEEEEEEEQRSFLFEALQQQGEAAPASSHYQQSKHLKHLDQHLVLVLNADYQPLSHAPLSLWSWQDAIKALFSGKVTVVDTYHPNVLIRAVNINVPLPSVIAFRDYSPRQLYKDKAKKQHRRPPFTRRNVYLRDGFKCQYCNNMFAVHELSIDHVHPRCKGGRLCWENAVTCCKSCNGRKGFLLPSELNQVGMKLVKDPKCPSHYDLGILALKFSKKRYIHPAWEPYII